MHIKQALFLYLLALWPLSINAQYNHLSTTTLTYSASPIDFENRHVKFAKDLAYDKYHETVFDVFLPESEHTTPLVLFIHGGGFINGDKNFLYKVQNTTEVKRLIDHKIAVITINYRLLDQTNETTGVLKPLHDARRALQYIRYHAESFNIDKTRIALSGNSAGAGTALWIAMHNDMRDTTSNDPVLHESTRVKAVGLKATQASYDVEGRWTKDVFVDYGLTFEDILAQQKSLIFRFYGVKSMSEYQTPAMQAYRKEVDMLAHISADDPAIWADNTRSDVAAPVTPGIMYHHAYHVREIKEKADFVGVPNTCYYGKGPDSYRDAGNESMVDFLIRTLQDK